MLKILSPAFAVALFLAWSYSAYSFDNKHFYTNNSGSTETRASKTPLEEASTGEEFEPGINGRFDKIPGGSEVNTIRVRNSGIQSQNGRDATNNAGENPHGGMNTSYSLSPSRLQLDSECGPSHMTATEIEGLVGRTAQTYGVDQGLAKAIAWAESRFDQNRNSDRGARGAMQLMPSTASELGVRDICDPASNIDGGVRHLKLMLDKFQNPILAAAAYNAGAQAVYDNGGVPPFPETVRYVAAVINHQMGLQMPRRTSAHGVVAAITGSTPSNEMASDVIGARGSRFIKGVMQF